MVPAGARELAAFPRWGTDRITTPPAGKAPACGKCGSALPWIVTASDADFTSQVSGRVPALVDFWAPWCAPCRMVAPVLEEIATEQAGRIKIVKLNVDENPMAAGAHRVQSIPTLILFKNGTPVERLVGALPKETLLARLRPHLSS